MTVDDTHPVVIPRLRVAHDRRVGEVGLKRHVIGGCLGRCLHLLERKMQTALMRVGKRLNVEKRHGLVRPVAPRGLVGGHVPSLLHVHLEIVIGLGVVRGVVALLAQHLRPRLHAGGQGGQCGFAVVLKSNPRRVHRRGQGCARHGANRRGGEGVIKREPLGGQALDVGRDAQLVAVEAEVVHRVILGDDEDKVWPLGRFGRLGQGGQRHGCEQTE